MIIPKYYEELHTLNVNSEPIRCLLYPGVSCPGSGLDRQTGDRPVLSAERGLEGSSISTAFMTVRRFSTRKGTAQMSLTRFRFRPNWQDHGYGLHQYTNTRYPFPFDPPYVPHENPCGAYVKTFHYSKPEGTATYHLNFEGVDSCYYVWLNGVFIGYHQVSHSTGEFDITAQLRDGENTLAVLVLQWCDGSYLEDQDKFRNSGIFRDVFILARPENYIRDYFTVTTLKNGYKDADVKIRLSLQAGSWPVSYKLMTPCGCTVAEGQAEGSEICFSVSDVTAWNAEAPYLYTLIFPLQTR